MVKIRLGKHRIRTPVICGSVIGKDIDEMKTNAINAIRQGADVIELRIDWLREQIDWEKLSNIESPVILTNRPKREGGKFVGDEKVRIESLLEGVKRVSCVDIELSTPKHLRDRVIKTSKRAGVTALVSHHNLSSTPAVRTLTSIAKRAVGAGCDIAKIVTFAKEASDVIIVLDFLVKIREEIDTPVVAFSMGQAGKVSRVVAPLLGSAIVYAAAGDATAPGQLSVATTKRLLDELGFGGRT